ncbi:5849_t:CDS:2 [Paraglomus occultum]|uniref:5849_t:CDS:1 n=1 Tax=Paraglomus occultum TaxID=144539 RepID=A0A9N8VIT3_9GLOM|nr:5849_t:CDS:2 [Paraglomus occultum]
MRFQVVDLSKKKPDGSYLFKDVSISLREREIITITGPSGVGKTTLLKCIAELVVFEEGKLYLDDKSPEQYDIPLWRTRVMYVPQRPVIMPGTPFAFHEKIRSYAALKKNRSAHEDPIEISARWGINEELWHSDWNRLSGGEMQRIMLALALSCKPDVLLLDEPTSALDSETCFLVEESLKEYACIWVTHDREQERRVAHKTLRLEKQDNGLDNRGGEAIINI